MGASCCGGPSLESLDKMGKWRVQFNALQLKESELRRMYKVFRKIDVDGSGSISVAELLVHINVNRTPFTQRIFSIFDEDGSGEIDFREFVLSLWNYCTLTKATLDMFSFDLYDRDGSGELSAKEVKKMLKDIYGKEYSTNFHAQNIKNDLKEIEKNGIAVDIEQFREFCRNHQALLFPAARMQLYLQQKVLGRGFWHKNSQRRIKLSKGKFVPIGKLLEMHVNKELMRQTLGDDVYAGLEAAVLQKQKSARDTVSAMRAFSSDDQDDDDMSDGGPSPTRQLSRSRSRSRDGAGGDGKVHGETDHTWFTFSHDSNDTNFNNVPIYDVMAPGYGREGVKLDMKAQVAVEATGMISKRKQALYLNDEAHMDKETLDTMNLKKNIDPTQRELNASNEQEIALMVAAMQQPTTVLASGSGSRPNSRMHARNNSSTDCPGSNDAFDTSYNSGRNISNKTSPDKEQIKAKAKAKSASKKAVQDAQFLSSYGPGEDMSDFIDEKELEALATGDKGNRKGAHAASGRTAASAAANGSKRMELNGVSSLRSDLQNDLDFPGLEQLQGSKHHSKHSNKLSPLPSSPAQVQDGGHRRKSLGSDPSRNSKNSGNSSAQQKNLKSISSDHAASNKLSNKQKDTKIVPLTTEMVEKQRQTFKAPDVAQRLAAETSNTTGAGQHGLNTAVAQKTGQNAGRATAQALIRARAQEQQKKESDKLYVSAERIAHIGKGEVRVAQRWEMEVINEEQRKRLKSAGDAGGGGGGRQRR